MLIRFLHQLPEAIGQFFLFVLIACIVGSICFVIGELLPRKNFDYTSFPYKPFRWERNGDVYLRLGIQKWKDYVPDMSKYVKTMFAKKIVSPRDPEYTRRLILETCVAETVHFVMILISPIFQMYMNETAGYIATIAYILGNLPFILIQRYNRPRLVRLMEKQIAAAERLKQTKRMVDA